MSLIKCTECKNDISDEAVFCPHCGYPIKEKMELDVAGKIIDKYELQVNGRVVDVMYLYLKCNKNMNTLYKEIMYAANCDMNAAKDLAYDFKESFDLSDTAINEYLWANKIIKNNISYTENCNLEIKKDIDNIYNNEENLAHDIKKIKFRVTVLYIFYIIIPLIFGILSIVATNSILNMLNNHQGAIYYSEDI